MVMVAVEQQQQEEGIFLLLLSLTCLGTWPALLRLCTYASSSTTISELEEETTIGGSRTSTSTTHANNHHNCIRRLANRYSQCRHPCHAYIDYAAAYVVFSSTVPTVLSYSINASDYNDDHDIDDDSNNYNYHEDTSSNSGSSSWHTLWQKLPLVLTASAGGSLLSLGNISTQWSTTIYASPLTTVLALQASLTVILGTTINYWLEPTKTARPNLLACGVTLFLVAIGLSVRAHTMYSDDKKKNGNEGGGTIDGAIPTSSNVDEMDDNDAGISMRDLVRPAAITTAHHSPGPLDYRACSNSDEDDGGGGGSGSSSSRWKGDQSQIFPRKAAGHDDLQSSSDVFVDDGCYPHTSTSCPLHIERMLRISAPNMSTMGLAVAFCGGLCFGFFSPAFNIAVNDPFHWGGNWDGGGGGTGLSVAVANFWFSVAFAATSVFWNVHLMRNPPISAPNVPRSTMHRYLSEGMRERVLAVLAGLICAAGNVLQFQGGRLCGYAASDLVQAFPLVGTAWDVMAFDEFHAARRIIFVCLSCMYLVYLGGIILLASSIAI